jgi:hypothetical protein
MVCIILLIEYGQQSFKGKNKFKDKSSDNRRIWISAYKTHCMQELAWSIQLVDSPTVMQSQYSKHHVPISVPRH